MSLRIDRNIFSSSRKPFITGSDVHDLGKTFVTMGELKCFLELLLGYILGSNADGCTLR